MSKNSEYWEKRIAQPTWNTYNSIEEKNIKLLDMYQQASKDISNELYSLAEKVNSGKGLTRSEMHKYNRLNNLNKNIRDILEDLTNGVADFSTKNMQEGFASNYSNVMNALNVADFALPDKKLMDTLIDMPWRGDSFSKRLWKDTGKLANNLNNILTSGLQQGKTVSEMAINLNNVMNKGFNAAHTLVRTETMHYLNVSSDTAYKDAGIKEVQNWAAEDERTCEHCAAEHGKIYPIDKAPTLPFHANCRCTRLPVLKPITKNNIATKNNGDIIELDDINIGKSLGAAASNHKVWVEGEGYYKLAEGTKITKVHVFAGKGTKTPVRVAKHLTKQYGGIEENWQHTRGEGIVNFEGKNRRAELHWFENQDVGKIKMKVKRWFE